MYSGEKCLQDFSREMRPLGCPNVGGRVILKWILKIWGEGPCIGLIWLRIRTGGGLL